MSNSNEKALSTSETSPGNMRQVDGGWSYLFQTPDRKTTLLEIVASDRDQLDVTGQNEAIVVQTRSYTEYWFFNSKTSFQAPLPSFEVAHQNLMSVKTIPLNPSVAIVPGIIASENTTWSPGAIVTPLNTSYFQGTDSNTGDPLYMGFVYAADGTCTGVIWYLSSPTSPIVTPPRLVRPIGCFRSVSGPPAIYSATSSGSIT